MTPNQQFAHEVADILAQKLGASLGRKSGPRLLNVEGAAEYISRSIKAMRQLISKGIVPIVRMDGRIFIDVRDLDKIIDESKVWAA